MNSGNDSGGCGWKQLMWTKQKELNKKKKE